MNPRTYRTANLLRRRIAVYVALLCCILVQSALSQPPATHHLTTRGKLFLLDGKPFQIISGEMHYPRIARADWARSFKMARAMGLNSVTAYVFWNIHETRPGTYDFTGNNDVAEFVREAQREGLYVILRPGPYVCAEWELGGFPAWLIKDRDVRLRTTEPKYMQAVNAWFKRLGRELAPLQAEYGGPILAVQVENEYGSYGRDQNYMRAIRQSLIDAGFNRSLLYSSDPPSDILHGSLPDMLTGVNFGAMPGKHVAENDKSASLTQLSRLRPDGPCFVGEYWDGWFDHWGSPWAFTDARQQADEFESMLRHGCSVSLYMFQGGTSFGWMNGANSGRPEVYEPDITSYDYDAALSENGAPTPKYFLFRQAIHNVTGVNLPNPPAVSPPLAIPAAPFSESASLWDILPRAIHTEHPVSMEDLDQSYGYLLYRIQLHAPAHGELTVDAIHQYAQVYLDGKLVGVMDRRKQINHVHLDSSAATAQLDILVENTGRVNYGNYIGGEHIGILGDVHLAGQTLLGWDTYSVPFAQPAALAFRHQPCTGPCIYRAHLQITLAGDTYLDTRNLGKGQLWINGHNLGRFWSEGPQGSLFVPASWLHQGTNDVIVFDLKGEPGRSIAGIPTLIRD